MSLSQSSNERSLMLSTDGKSSRLLAGDTRCRDPIQASWHALSFLGKLGMIFAGYGCDLYVC